MVVNMHMGLVALVKFVHATVATNKHYKIAISITFIFDSAMFFCTLFWVLNVLREDHKWRIGRTMRRALPTEWCTMRALFNFLQLLVFFPLGIIGIIRAARISMQPYVSNSSDLSKEALLKHCSSKNFTDHINIEDEEQKGLPAPYNER